MDVLHQQQNVAAPNSSQKATGLRSNNLADEGSLIVVHHHFSSRLKVGGRFLSWKVQSSRRTLLYHTGHTHGHC